FSALHALFFEVPARHRGLCSFPTRRSSDLSAGVRNEDAAMPVSKSPTASRARCCDSKVEADMPLFASQLLKTIRENCPPAWNAGDRKSTRLNSSHVKISYAVFCLKKKINKR